MPSAAHPIPSALLALSPVMRAVRERLEAFAPAPLSVVIVGPTGSGKSLLGRYLHERSALSGPFVDCPCGELEPNLAKSDLFGHLRGAFTGAAARRRGLLAEAATGTLMLDDFHLLRAEMQGLLLRALAERQYRELGAERSVPLAARVVFGMCEDPDDLVARGKLLADLRQRLGQALVRVPGLAERREEIAPLASTLLARYAAERGEAGPRRFTPAAVGLLERAEWPGNVRQLEHTVWAAWEVARHAGAAEVGVADIEGVLPASPPFAVRGSREEKLAAVEWALARSGGRVGRAAAALGVARNTVAAWRRRLGST